VKSCLFVCLLVCLFVCLFLCLFVCLFLCFFVCLFVWFIIVHRHGVCFCLWNTHTWQEHACLLVVCLLAWRNYLNIITCMVVCLSVCLFVCMLACLTTYMYT
jgi:hypothetical protein